MGRDLVADDLVVLGCFVVDIIQRHGAFHLGIRGKVHHEPPRPPTGTTADVGNFQVFYAVVFIIHGLKPPFVLVRNIDACKTAKFAFFAVFLLSVYIK